MAVETHPAYPEEVSRLRETLEQVRTQLKEIRAIPPLNFPELIDDSMEAMLVAEMAMDRLRQQRKRRLEQAERETYFGRLDYQEAGMNGPERLYIGKAGVQRDGHDPMVVDWRAPIAGLFYATAVGSSEEAEYEAPDGKHSAVIWLKRNLGIKHGVLQRIVDSKVRGVQSETEGILDEFLSYRLQESRDSRLRDIVATIQGEQNAIVRAPMDQPLIIQGVAGSGKTTVALHRLAYLLYTHQDSIAAGRIIIFAPNRMFLDYISDVLPELGVDGVQQTTFADWALAELDEPAYLTDPSDRLAALFEPGEDRGAGPDAPGRFKGSLLFQEVLDLALAAYEGSFVPDQDLELWPGARLPIRAVREWYYQSYRSYPLMARKERCIARARKWADDQYTPLQGTMHANERRQAMNRALQRWIKLWPAHTAVELYREIVCGRPARRKSPAEVGHPDIPRAVALDSLRLARADEIGPEDLAPLVYIKSRLQGFKAERLLDHIVIDEAQDFSPFQLELLKLLTRNNSFTILGDLSQGIHAYQGIQRWDEFVELFAPDPVGYYTLELSYRSTFEVMSFANQVISAVGAPAALAQPVFRAGDQVRVRRVAPAELATAIAAQVAALRAQKHASIAVVGRTEAECRRLHAAMAEQGLESELITPRQSSYHGGLSVMPVYLTKGLEFDAVIVADASADAYRLSLRDAKLLYVACTRALHALSLFYTGTPSPLLPAAG